MDLSQVILSKNEGTSRILLYPAGSFLFALICCSKVQGLQVSLV